MTQRHRVNLVMVQAASVIRPAMKRAGSRVSPLHLWWSVIIHLHTALARHMPIPTTGLVSGKPQKAYCHVGKRVGVVIEKVQLM